MKLKLNWESALLALLIAEILLFGALNPRMAGSQYAAL
ncbi:Uncharacterised protein [Klebsiella variicola]|uniref:Uncharacterized protein n=1 Tax=Klebsiella variicola TaxID=244366 RepID=A0A7H4M7Y0_KLEVA|nr:Uncharacterised protein [Klebsiella variicola]